ncbi:MAG: formimidoylglutamate deiminase [Gammaproteobacteria bacterium]|nr:formimidoylglutamate deiminase [Gammaproteobacteria bacterium]
MTTIFAKKAFLRDGWAENVRLKISDGLIQSVDVNSKSHTADVREDIVLPGIANAHSHAFQRALVGHSEKREPKSLDNFWSWRTQMYRLANIITPEQLSAIASQLYSEMISFGYTSVAEFHYLHGAKESTNRSQEMYMALAQAAEDSGIRLCYVPILYERSGFGSDRPRGEQHRFAMLLEEFIDHYEQVRESANTRVIVGLGAHSLRAVHPDSLSRLAQLSLRDGCPLHIHISEQMAEVEQCLAHHKARPIEWLLKELPVDRRWCLVHATHASEQELDALAETHAVICLCPSTEANLGDGIFKLNAWLEKNGRIAIGSDSHVTVNPFEELRWIEYEQRLLSRSRNVAVFEDTHIGQGLFQRVVQGGTTSCGHSKDSLCPGGYADLVCLDEQHPVLLGHESDSILDALVFSGYPLPINRVMVGGAWYAAQGVHIYEKEIKKRFQHVVGDLWNTAQS